MHWGRAVGLAFALEAALFAVLLPLQPLLSLHVWFAAVAASCFLFAYAAGWLVVRGLTSRGILHGTLVGVVATGIYLLINVCTGGIGAAMAFYGPPLFVAVNALRIAGSVAGAFHHGRRVRPAPATV